MDTTAAFPALRGAEFMVLTTHRRTGEPVHTTVWFAQVDDRLYVTTMRGSGKVKRIQNTEQVRVAPSDARGTMHGPAAPARARVLAPAEFPVAIAALQAKYNPRFDEILARPEASGERVYLEVRPAE